MQEIEPGKKRSILREFRKILTKDKLTSAALRYAQQLKLSDCWIVSGCLYQTVWNVQSGKPSGYGVKDIDLIYFDDTDLSYAAEDAVIQRATPIFADLPAPVEIRNQARVHLWYPQRFGQAYPRLTRATESLLYYASRTHALAARLTDDDQLEVEAPFGLEDVFARRITPNTALDNRETHLRKAQRAMTLWPDIEFIPWPEEVEE